jgi:hypothetical protein
VSNIRAGRYSMGRSSTKRGLSDLKHELQTQNTKYRINAIDLREIKPQNQPDFQNQAPSEPIQ